MPEKLHREEIWNSMNYPTGYVESFSFPTEVAVKNYVDFVKATNLPINRILLEVTEQGSIVYPEYLLRSQKKNRYVTINRAVNWGDPAKRVGDYDEYYEGKFFAFLGPNNPQKERAELLAEILGVDLEIRVGSESLIRAREKSPVDYLADDKLSGKIDGHTHQKRLKTYLTYAVERMNNQY